MIISVVSALLVVLLPQAPASSAPAPSVPGSAAGQQLEIDGELLKRVAGQVFEQLERDLELPSDQSLSGQLEVRAVSRTELAEVCSAEWLPHFKRQMGGEEEALKVARAYGTVLSQKLLAKYVPEQDLILVCVDNFASLAEALSEPTLNSEQALFAALTHQSAMALDARIHAWPERVAGLEDPEQRLVFYGVVHGHALHRARSICRGARARALEVWLKTIGTTALAEDPDTRYLSRIAAIDDSLTHLDGERFMASLAAHDEELLARAFANPPSDVEQLFHPEWFIDPQLEPAQEVYDLETPLDLFVERFEPELWEPRRISLTTQDIGRVFGALGEAFSRRVLSGLSSNRVAHMGLIEGPPYRSATFAFYQFASSAEAINFVASDERIWHLNDERMKGGRIKIVASSYRDISGPMWHGLWNLKSAVIKGVDGKPEEITWKAVCAARGKLAVELVFQHEPIEDSAMSEILTLACTSVLTSQKPSEAAGAEGVRAGEAALERDEGDGQ